MHSQQPPGVVQNWSTLQCSKHDIERCGYDHAPVTRGRMRTQFPLPHGPPPLPMFEANSQNFASASRGFNLKIFGPPLAGP